MIFVMQKALFIFAFTGFSRIYVGHHYPIDVLGSILVALSVTLILFKAFRLLRPIPNVIIYMYNKISGVPKNKRFEQKNLAALISSLLKLGNGCRNEFRKYLV